LSEERRPEERALDRLILELREAPAPELDWQRIEAHLMQEPLAAPVRVSRSLFDRLRLPMAAVVAVAAAAALAVSHKPAAVAVPSMPQVKASSVPLNGDQLALGTRVTAGNEPLLVEHPGRAKWTLEPHGTALVSEAGEFLTVKLLSGALSAAVVPNPKPETFAVEVEGTRVAVHGTAFRVERSTEHVQVEVSEGTVAVEPSGTHSAPNFLLRRNSRGNFGFDGHTGSVEGNASAMTPQRGGRQSHRTLLKVAPRVAPAQAPSSTPAVPSAKPEVSSEPIAPTQVLPAQPSISDIESGVTSALQLMDRCFHDQTRSTGNSVSANTALTLSVAGDGSIQSVTFAPPLAPAVEDCAVSGLRGLTFTRSIEGVTFTRLLELSR